jgi:hypothetical protein
MEHTESNKDYIATELKGVHDQSKCKGDVCVIHNPSGHHMHTWPLYWRDDRGIMERICKHGVGHPDPDCAAARNDSIHGCCGCCTLRQAPTGTLGLLWGALNDRIEELTELVIRNRLVKIDGVYHTSTDVNLLRTAYKDIVRLIEQVAKKAGQ